MRADRPRGAWRQRVGNRRRVPHAIVVSYAALFVALAGGTAYAAKHYLINSTKQIKPSVRRALRGATGPRGAVGATGATGAPGPAVTLLPSGKTETGVFFAEGTATTVGDLAAASISFTVPLASSPTPTVVTSAPTAACPGSATAPTATAGSLCIYVGAQQNAGVIAVYDPFGGVGGTASSYGAGVGVDSAAAGNFYADGTWAVKAQ